MSTKTVSVQDQFKEEVTKTRTRVNNLRKNKPDNLDVEQLNMKVTVLGRMKIKNQAKLNEALADLKAINIEISKLEK